MRVLNLFALLVFAACAGQLPQAAAEPVVIGWIERIKVGREGLVMTAKLDTGADTSSMHVASIHWTRREDGDWVTFETAGDDGRTVRLERKVKRVVRVRGASGGSQRRPTIELGVCLGGVYRSTDVNLTNRSDFRQPFLVGRSFLAGHFAVDSSRTHTVEPSCEGAPQ